MLGGKTDHHMWRWTHSWPCFTNHMFKTGQWKPYLHMWDYNEQDLHSQVYSTCSPWNHSLQNCLVTLTLSSRRYGVSFAHYNLIYYLMLHLGDLPVLGVWYMKKRHIKVIMPRDMHAHLSIWWTIFPKWTKMNIKPLACFIWRETLH